MKKFTAFIASILLTACQHSVEQPVAVTPVVPEKPITYNGAKIVGGVETLYITPMQMPFQARMDTGAKQGEKSGFCLCAAYFIRFGITRARQGRVR